jgi:hypothetical protein
MSICHPVKRDRATFAQNTELARICRGCDRHGGFVQRYPSRASNSIGNNINERGLAA